LLARAPRLRLPAEIIRDQALAASGLLNPVVGGPSVKTYQPPGLWSELANLTYEQDTGDLLYRRSMYIFWKRTLPPPLMTTFDASSRETCVLARSRTNTPLQALALMNDVTFVEAARSLAERMLRDAGPSADDRIRRGFQLVLARQPVELEHQILMAALERNMQKFGESEQAASQLITVGDSQPDRQLVAGELAAYTVVASLILNLDEAVMRE